MSLLRGARIQHVALSVTDLDAALEFYSGRLGLRQLPRPDVAGPGAWLALGEHQQVHLFAVADTDADAALGARRDHFAVEVDDLDALLADLDTAGVEYRRIPPIPGAGHQAFVRDPSGNRIEFRSAG